MKPGGRSLARVAVGVAGTALGLRLGARTSACLGPLEVAADLDLDPAGGVRIDIPPLGTARLRTHRGPLQVRVTATGVDPSRVDGLLDMPTDHADAADIRARFERTLAAVGGDAQNLARALAVRSVIAGIGGATALGALAFRRRRDIAGAAVVSTAALGVAAAVAAATADKDAWRDPQLTGLLTKAPLILGDLQQAPARLGTYRDQLAELVATATDVYARVVELPEAPPGDAIRLVHISDLHLSPLGVPLAKTLVEQYHADAVIDTGDFVDWGTPAEDVLAGQIADLDVPYLYVKGNHDSAGTARAIAKQPNATVFEVGDEPREIVGLRFAGMADPRFTPDKTTGDDRPNHRVADASAAFAEAIRGKQIDVALVHSPAAARPLAGLVPLVLAGDIHRRETKRYGDTTVLVQGTSGGAGLRGVQVDPPTPVSLSVLFVDRASRRLWGVDEITLAGIGRTEVSVVRRTVAELTA
ncbi:MAG: metallophosphoesterase family protein [Jatrophihabitans sp.]